MGDDKLTGGGHGPGRNRPNKTEFPSGWSDEQVISAIVDVANDPKSSRRVQESDRIVTTGTRDGVHIEVIIEPDKKTVVTGYPTNLPRNPRGLMSDSEREENLIESALERLCNSIAKPTDKGYSDIKKFIYVHEFQLALDLLAHIQLQSEVAPSPETRALFEDLAQEMGMTDGDMWRGVAKVRKAQI